MNAQIVTNGETGWLVGNGEKIDNIYLTSVKPENVKPEIIESDKRKYMVMFEPTTFKISGILKNDSCFY